MANTFTLNPDPDDFYYPLSFLDPDYRDCYDLADINTQMFGEELLDPSGFPYNIETWIFGQEGANDEESWVLLCKLTSGVYAYYRPLRGLV
jgi:hypothetical protein